ncbi:MAG: hypothetical protein AAF629_29965 [Chloroflexota bacterium]
MQDTFISSTQSEASQIDWCFRLNDTMGPWFSTLFDRDYPGRIRFCNQGNLIEPTANTGLGASCLALKATYQTGVWEQLEPDMQSGWIAHIQSFQEQETGYFEDAAILAVADARANWSLPKKVLNRVRRKLGYADLAELDAMSTKKHRPEKYTVLNTATRRAETRQACAALLAAGSRPLYPINHIPASPEAILAYLDDLPWYLNPWHAGSHTAYLIFALKLNADIFNQQTPFQKHVPIILSYLDQLQDPETGSWFRNSWFPREVPLNQKVNGAMKVLTGYSLLDKPVQWPEKLIDLCLRAYDDRDACHSVDLIYILHECAKWTTHRQGETEAFAEKLLGSIEKHCKPDGGLSFYPTHANTMYYGVPISTGLPESDVHGSHLLIWAATLCLNLLDLKPEFKWRLPIT